jgi:outer membrane autotransporter protein
MKRFVITAMAVAGLMAGAGFARAQGPIANGYIYADTTGFGGLVQDVPGSFNFRNTGDLLITRTTSLVGSVLDPRASTINFAAGGATPNPAYIAGSRRLFSIARQGNGGTTVNYRLNFGVGISPAAFLVFSDFDVYAEQVRIRALDVNGNLIPFSALTFRQHNGQTVGGQSLNYVAFTDVGGGFSGQLANTSLGPDQTNPVVTVQSSVAIKELEYEFNLLVDPVLPLSPSNVIGFNFSLIQDLAEFAVTPNQEEVGGGLNEFIDSLEGDRPVVLTVLVNLDLAEIPGAFEQMMPAIYATLPTLAFNQANALNMNMFQRMWMQRVDGSGFSTMGLEPLPYADGKQFVARDGKSTIGRGTLAADVISDPFADPRWGVFADGNGIFSTMDNIGNLGSYDSQGGGVTAGLSYRWNRNLSTGVYAGYQGLQAKYDDGSRLVDNAVRFGTFASWGANLGPGDVYVSAIVGGAYHDYDIDRKIQFGTIDRTARGTPGAWELDAALATGYNFEAGGFVFGPVTSLQYTYLAVQGFTETGAEALNLDVDPYHSSSLLYSLGGQVAYPIEVTRDFSVTPMLFASWQHEFLQNAYKINSAFVGGGNPAPFSYETNDPLRDFLYAGVGIGWAWGDRWEGYVSYSASAGNPQLISHNIFLGVGVKF